MYSSLLLQFRKLSHLRTFVAMQEMSRFTRFGSQKKTVNLGFRAKKTEFPALWSKPARRPVTARAGATPESLGLLTASACFHGRRQQTWAIRPHRTTIAGEICNGCEAIPTSTQRVQDLKFEVTALISSVESNYSGRWTGWTGIERGK